MHMMASSNTSTLVDIWHDWISGWLANNNSETADISLHYSLMRWTVTAHFYIASHNSSIAIIVTIVIARSECSITNWSIMILKK